MGQPLFAPTWLATCFEIQRPPGRFFFGWGVLRKEKPRLSVVDQTGQEVPGAGGRLFEDERARIGQTVRSLTQDPAAALTYDDWSGPKAMLRILASARGNSATKRAPLVSIRRGSSFVRDPQGGDMQVQS